MTLRVTRRYGFGVFATATAISVCLIGQASAAEVTRDSYREAVEPICRVNTEANERIFNGVRTKVQHDKLRQAGAQFDRASTALKKALDKLRQVPQPPADQKRLAKWLDFGELEANLFGRTAHKLQAGDKRGAVKLVSKLQHTATLANNVVFPFEFDYCRFEPSRFT